MQGRVGFQLRRRGICSPRAQIDRRLQFGKVLIKYATRHETDQQGDADDDHQDVVKLAKYRDEVWNGSSGSAR